MSVNRGLNIYVPIPCYRRLNFYVPISFSVLSVSSVVKFFSSLATFNIGITFQGLA